MYISKFRAQFQRKFLKNKRNNKSQNHFFSGKLQYFFRRGTNRKKTFSFKSILLLLNFDSCNKEY